VRIDLPRLRQRTRRTGGSKVLTLALVVGPVQVLAREQSDPDAIPIIASDMTITSTSIVSMWLRSQVGS